MIIYDEYILAENLSIGPPEPPNLKPKLNPVNIHSGLWAVFGIHGSDETLSQNERDIFIKAQKILDDKVPPDELIELIEDVDLNFSAESIIVYAKKLINK